MLELTVEHPRVVRHIKAGSIHPAELAPPTALVTSGLTASQQLKAASSHRIEDISRVRFEVRV
jgi:hypothetical protein